MKHKVHVINIAPAMEGLAHGTHDKTMFVCHETVSYNTPGLGDIQAVERVLRQEGYGIHGMTDKDGNKCWARGHGKDVFWHAGNVNSVAVGCENVSEIPILVQGKHVTHEQAFHMWMSRDAQLSALAMLIACWHNVNPKEHKLSRSDGRAGSPGVCSHWDVSQHPENGTDHWDCWPVDAGGYFPLEHVIDLAKTYAKHYTF